jgi:CHAD domain-containing protein
MPQENSGRPWALVALPGIVRRTSKNPTATSVHKLRTTIRRVETLLQSTGSESEHKKLMKQVARIRKAAGHVRDVDVHLEIVQQLDRRGVASDFSELKSYLKRRRVKRGKKLTELLSEELDGGVIKRLKSIGADTAGAGSTSARLSVGAIATEFLSKATPVFSEAGLHKFRVECKHLRYSAELVPESRERDTLVSELKKVQDAIGAWHDVLTLRATAEDLLGTTRPIISLLRTLAQSRLNEAQRTISKGAAAVRRFTESLPPKKSSQAQSNSDTHKQAATA